MTIPFVAFTIPPEQWIGSILHMCEHWDYSSAVQKGTQPWADVGELGKVLTDISARLKDVADRLQSHQLRIPLDIAIVD